MARNFIFIKLLSKQPLWLHYVWADYVLYPLVYYVLRYRRKVVRMNLTNSFPEKSGKEIRSIERKFYHHFADVIVEILWGYQAPLSEVKKHVRFEYPDSTMEDMVEHGGFMGLLAHMGNWEWTAEWHHVIENYGVTEYNVYRKLKNEFWNELMLDIRCKRGGGCIEKNQLLRRVVGFRRDGEKVVYGMLCDQTPTPRNARVWVEFLNQDTPFLDGGEVLGRKYGYPWYYVSCLKPARGQYIYTLKKIEENAGEDHSVTRQYAQILEQNILAQPEIWLWTHRRWKYKRSE